MRGEESIKLMVDALSAEGVDPVRLTGVECKLRRWLYEAHTYKAVSDLFPKHGYRQTAEMLNIGKSTVYRILHRRRKNAMSENIFPNLAQK